MTINNQHIGYLIWISITGLMIWWWLDGGDFWNRFPCKDVENGCNLYQLYTIEAMTFTFSFLLNLTFWGIKIIDFIVALIFNKKKFSFFIPVPLKHFRDRMKLKRQYESDLLELYQQIPKATESELGFLLIKEEKMTQLIERL